MSEKIVAAALYLGGLTFSLPRPARHAQVMHTMMSFFSPQEIAESTQGFLTSEGRFVNRIEAKQIAHRAKQPILRADIHPVQAFSEDFW